MAGLGIAHVPQGRGTFPELTVDENLEVGAYVRKDRSAIRSDIDRWYEMFPRLAERRSQAAGSLSGGEQQMLAVARALMSRPRLLLLDEPSLGLAPIIIQDLFAKFDELNEAGGRDDVHRRAERQPRPRHRRPRLRAGGRPDRPRPAAPPTCAPTTPSAAPTSGSEERTMPDLLAFPGIEDNFFTLTLFLQNLANALANGAVYALMALTVVMIYKTTGHLNFAQGEMAMFCTFVVFVLAVEQGLNVWLAIGLVVIAAMVVGAAFERFLIQPLESRSVLAPVILTLGLFFILNGGAATIWGTQPKYADPGPVPGRARRQDRRHHRPGRRTSSSPTRRSACGSPSPCW